MTATQIRTGTAPQQAGDDEPAIRMQGVTKQFGDFTAVRHLDLDIQRGEFFSLLGPSGSGKTTVLRLIAGFETPSAGAIYLGGRNVTSMPPFDRAVNTVFQDYALFPHMTVFQNVEYGLKLRRTPKAARRREVERALDTIRLPHVADRLPSQLSGGQRQRVALARALVLKPEVLLLDEPLGALDKQLREQMQIELKQIQRQVGITFVFVTHDQEEALTLSDRVAVFNEGTVEQVGSPEDLYERPATRFVAGFLGTTNLIEGALAQRFAGSTGLHSVRPEHIRIRPIDSAIEPQTHHVEATIREVVYTGPATRYAAETADGETLIALAGNDAPSGSAARGDRVRLEWPARFTYAV